MRVGPDCEIYTVRRSVWKRAGFKGEWGDGCLCIGCLEKRIGRRLKPKDFPAENVGLNDLPGTPRLLNRRGERTAPEKLPPRGALWWQGDADC
jgi:hypothetical protein